MLREYGELCIMKAYEVDDSGNTVQNGVTKQFLFDKGTQTIVFIDPGKGIPYLLDRREKIIARRGNNSDKK